MKPTSKLTLASLVSTGLLMSLLIWKPDPDSPVTLAGVCVFFIAIYFTFRFNRQIKQQIAVGSIPTPTVDAKRRHFWTLAISLFVGMVGGSIYLLYTLITILGLGYTLLALFPYVAFIAYLIYWAWQKHYRIS